MVITAHLSPNPSLLPFKEDTCRIVPRGARPQSAPIIAEMNRPRRQAQNLLILRAAAARTRSSCPLCLRIICGGESDGYRDCLTRDRAAILLPDGSGAA